MHEDRVGTRGIRTLVVDDEKLARSGLRAMLARDADLIVEECSGGREAVRLIRAGGIDLVFLDVQMPKVGGFDVIAAVGAENMPVVVFTTAYSEYAIEAFDACALDYLLKPVHEDRLSQAVARAREAVRQRRLGHVSEQLVELLARAPSRTTADEHTEADATETEKGVLRRVQLRSGDRTYYVDVADIDWIEADKYYARIWTGVRSHLLRQSLSQLEDQLDPAAFVRVHRAAIVNTASVREVRQVGISRYVVVLHDGTQVPMSRDQRHRLHDALRARR